jgi:cytidine deaminase/ASC-1-like (ASCH) protein
MKYNLNLNDRAFNAIINKTKRVEIRTNTGNHDYSKFVIGDTISFCNSQNEKILCKVIENNHYKSVEELLMQEGTRYTTSSTNDYCEAIKNINKLNGYEEAVKKYGIYAIHIEYLYKENDIWNELYNRAKEVLNPRKVSDIVEAGGVAAAILSKNGNIYTGVCIDTACSIGMCAERNAISTMITSKENEIDKLVCIGSKGNIMLPCGVCREFMMQIDKNNSNTEILINIDTKETITLDKLLPSWWK